MIPLQAIDSHVTEQFCLCCRFHTLSHSKHLELLGHSDQRFSHDLIVRRVLNVMDKTAINFHHIEVEIFEPLKRDQSRAEIIEGEIHAIGLHVLHKADQHLMKLHRRSFTNFKDQPRPDIAPSVQACRQGSAPFSIRQ